MRDFNNLEFLILVKKKFLQKLTDSKLEVSEDLGKVLLPLLLQCVETSILESISDMETEVSRGE